jgi:hypothetical protein
LIYTLPDLKWHKISDCVWSSKVSLKGKVLISEQYSDLKEFFVDFLGVKVPDLGMLVQELKKVAKSDPSAVEVISLIWQINAMSPAGKDLEALKKSKIFPVRLANGKVELCSKEVLFAISDRKILGDAFDGRIDFLDFSLEEVRRLRPFLSCLGLEDRYLSTAAIETSSFERGGEHYTKEWTRHLRRRAHALFRYALPLIQHNTF